MKYTYCEILYNFLIWLETMANECRIGLFSLWRNVKCWNVLKRISRHNNHRLFSHRLQEQLVLDCFATFEPPARPDTDPVTSSNRDLAVGPTRQPSNLLKRLQGVANRDKVVGTIGSSLRGRVAGGRTVNLRGEKEEDVSTSSTEAGHLQSSGSVRSRGGSGPGPGNDFRSKVCTKEIILYILSI